MVKFWMYFAERDKGFADGPDGGCVRKSGVRMRPRDLARVIRTIELPWIDTGNTVGGAGFAGSQF